jgi:predicted nuclease of predicted toxin-antitoxin system
VKFLIDAQLPRRMTTWFVNAGQEAMHTLELPVGNRTPDEQINDIAQREKCILITKDADFVDSHLLRSLPPTLLLISTGNINNAELEALLVPLIADIVREFQSHTFLELGRGGLVIRA